MMRQRYKIVSVFSNENDNAFKRRSKRPGSRPTRFKRSKNSMTKVTWKRFKERMKMKLKFAFYNLEQRQRKLKLRNEEMRLESKWPKSGEKKSVLRSRRGPITNAIS